jgi:hypothetical protein
MSRISKAALDWMHNGSAPTDKAVKLSVVDVGIAASRKTAVAHYVTDAAEITSNGASTLVARWLCGGSGSIDAVAHQAIEGRRVVLVLRGPLPARHGGRRMTRVTPPRGTS